MTDAAPDAWTILKILRWTTDFFQEKDVAEPRASAEVLLAHVLGLSRLDLYLRYDQPLAPEELSRFKALMLRRRHGEPVAYLTGHREFWSLDFLVTPGVLIPRPETEILVSAAVEAAKDFLAARNQRPTMSPWAVEIGIGSGAVVVSLARELPQFTWLGLDLSAAALAVARDNARRHAVAERLHLVRGDLLAGLKPRPRFALMVANLPYVPRAAWEQLPGDIKDYEPPQALLGGEDGLDLIRVLTRQAHLYLQPGGCLALEVGAGQAEMVLELLRQTGAYLDKKDKEDKKDKKNLEILADYQGMPRVVRARRSLD